MRAERAARPRHCPRGAGLRGSVPAETEGDKLSEYPDRRLRRVGRRLVHVLERLGHDVSVLDEDAANLALLNELEPPFSGMAVAGVPIDGDVLRSAGIEACDAVAAVTKDDNINLMVAQIARELFGVKHVIARVAEPSRKEVYTERFGLRIVCGTNLTAQGLLAGILQEEDDEDQCVMFGSSTANFSAVPAAKHQ